MEDPREEAKWFEEHREEWAGHKHIGYNCTDTRNATCPYADSTCMIKKDLEKYLLQRQLELQNAAINLHIQDEIRRAILDPSLSTLKPKPPTPSFLGTYNCNALPHFEGGENNDGKI